MSRPAPSGADLVARASEPCHHRREPFGPCETCLEEAIEEALAGPQEACDEQIANLKSDHASTMEELLGEKKEAEEAYVNVKNNLDDLREKLTAAQEAINGAVEEMESVDE